VLQETGLDAVAHHPLGPGLASSAAWQDLATARRHALPSAIVDTHVAELRERPRQRKPGAADHRSDQPLKSRAKERSRRCLLEALLKRARSDEAETPHEDRANGRKSQRLPH